MDRFLNRGLMTCAILASTTSCVGLSLFGVPLGPQTADGLYVEGVVAPGVGTCTYANPATIFWVSGEMEIGTDNTATNEYVAILQTTNNMTSNCTRGTQPNYGGTYGCTNTVGITAIAANIRYEYPTLSALTRFTNQQAPSDGFLLQNQASATGYAKAAGQGQITVKIMDRTLARQLAQDPDFQSRLSSDGSVPIVARVKIEGRTDGGGRATSNEFTFRIEAVPAQTLNNCGVPCPAGQTRAPALQCFSGQDQAACTGCR